LRKYPTNNAIEELYWNSVDIAINKFSAEKDCPDSMHQFTMEVSENMLCGWLSKMSRAESLYCIRKLKYRFQ
jgi:hypothetical protein